MKRLRSLGITFSVDSDGSLRVAASNQEVGDLLATFENDEISIFIGEHTHSHFTPGACGDIDAPDSIEECVSAAGVYVQEVLSDKFIIWSAGSGIGGSYHIEHVTDPPTPNARFFTWSGPVTE